MATRGASFLRNRYLNDNCLFALIVVPMFITVLAAMATVVVVMSSAGSTRVHFWKLATVPPLWGGRR